MEHNSENYLIDERMSVKEYLNAYPVKIEHLTAKEAQEIYINEDCSLQTFGCTNYKDCRNWTKEQILDKVLTGHEYQKIHFYRNGKHAEKLVIFGYRGGYSAFLLFNDKTPFAL